MKTIIVVLLLALCNVVAEEINSTLHYDPGKLLDKIFNPNILARQSGYGLIKFDEETDIPTGNDGKYKLVFQDQPSHKLRFEEQQNSGTNPSFDEQNNYYQATRPSGNQNYGLEDQGYGFYQGSGFDGHTSGIGSQNSGIGRPNSGQVNFQDDNTLQGQPGSSGVKKRRRRRRKPKNQGPGLEYPGYPGPAVSQGYGLNPYVNPEFYRPPPRPKPSIASQTLSAVTEALSSIALYDDYQCVPRLLCEAAGSGALGSAGYLQSAVGLQPLLTLLAAYNGVSSSPLFIFGRAVFLGMTSKGNTGTCRYAYPQCPTDPEQLVYYLNNHNGGFFRFFNAPQNQNLEQFYNQLSGQGQYGLYQPNPTQINQNQGYGLQNLYVNQQNYGSGYPYDNNGVNYNRPSYKEGKIENRIQNKPSGNFVEDNLDYDHNSKWLFPEAESFDDYNNNNDLREDPNENREGKRLRFPGEYTFEVTTTESYKRRGRRINFPNDQGYKYTNSYYQTTAKPNNYVDYNHKYYVKREKEAEDDGVRTIYVVRGNGDPNHPEVIKLRPGQTYY